MKQTIPASYLKPKKKDYPKVKNFKTVAVRNVVTGEFEGRERVKGTGDRTTTRFLDKNRDLNHNGRIEPWERGGTIHGRTESIPVRASKRARGYSREI